MARRVLKYFAHRTCTKISEDINLSHAERYSRTLSRGVRESEFDNISSGALLVREESSKSCAYFLEDLRDIDAYVLLGAPGMGKSEAFKREGSKYGCQYITVREFITLNHELDNGTTTLFIDSLDETRVGLPDGRRAIDVVLKKLQQLGCPRFRLSCREADWFGSIDRKRLQIVSHDNRVYLFQLNPLTEEQVINALTENYEIDNPYAFVTSAKRYGIEELLYNPQTLEMLVNSVQQLGGQTFPTTRYGTFRLSCRNLLREHNKEHRLVYRSLPYDPNTLIDSAGKLCAVQLLSNSLGYTLAGGTSSSDYPDLERVIDQGGDVIYRVVRSKLFHTSTENHIVPIHRQVAEFLAARFLSNRINEGLPVNRVLALMGGFDGGVVSELRGLSAWLSVHCEFRRKEIMERDPLGTLLYGDVKEFTDEEKIFLLRLLYKESKETLWHLINHESNDRIGDLLTEGVALEIQNLFLQSLNDDEGQSFAQMAIELLCCGDPVNGMSEFLMTILRDDFIPSSIKSTSIDAYLHQCHDKTEAYANLKQVLDDIYAETIADPNNELIDQILTRLYPELLNEYNILSYFRIPRNSLYIDYEIFWGQQVRDQSTPDQLACLLDQVDQRNEELKLLPRYTKYWTSKLRQFSRAWLRRYLEMIESDVDRDRLYGWLGFASGVDDPESLSIPEGKDTILIATWIERHSELHQWLIEKGLSKCIDAQGRSNMHTFSQCVNTEWKRLFGAAKPENYGFWCISKAEEISDESAKIWLIHEVADWASVIRHENRNVAEEVLKGFENKSGLKDLFDEKQKRFEFISQSEGKGLHQKQIKERRNKWREYLGPHKSALRENRADMQLLSKLALVYVGGYSDISGENPRTRLIDLVGNDDELLSAILQGLREAIDRNDVPSHDDVLKLHSDNKRHLLTLPIIAGLEEISSDAPEYVVGLDNEKLRLLIALHYVEPYWRIYIEDTRIRERKSVWFPALLKDYPNFVSEVMFKFVRAQLNTGKGGISGVYELARSSDYKDVAKVVSLRLLKAFPVRCREVQLTDLGHLLLSAIFLCESDQLIEIIERKLSSGSMNAGQRIFWIVAGLLISSEKHTNSFDTYVSEVENWGSNLERCIDMLFFHSSQLAELLDIVALTKLIQHVGSICNPSTENTFMEHDGVGIDSRSVRVGFTVQKLIDQLASNPSEIATNAIQKLIENDNLAVWRSKLLNAANQQLRTRREAEYCHLGFNQVLETLQNRKPASPPE